MCVHIVDNQDQTKSLSLRDLVSHPGSLRSLPNIASHMTSSSNSNSTSAVSTTVYMSSNISNESEESNSSAYNTFKCKLEAGVASNKCKSEQFGNEECMWQGNNTPNKNSDMSIYPVKIKQEPEEMPSLIASPDAFSAADSLIDVDRSEFDQYLGADMKSTNFYYTSDVHDLSENSQSQLQLPTTIQSNFDINGNALETFKDEVYEKKEVDTYERGNIFTMWSSLWMNGDTVDDGSDNNDQQADQLTDSVDNKEVLKQQLQQSMYQQQQQQEYPYLQSEHQQSNHFSSNRYPSNNGNSACADVNSFNNIGPDGQYTSYCDNFGRYSY